MYEVINTEIQSAVINSTRVIIEVLSYKTIISGAEQYTTTCLTVLQSIILRSIVVF